MQNKNSFVLYNEYYDKFCALSREERGDLIMAIFEYQRGGVVESSLTPVASMAFSFIKSQLERDNNKYHNICERNQSNGVKGGRPRKTQENPKNPSGYFENPRKPKKPDNDNDNENDNENDNVNENDISPSARGKTCSPKANDAEIEKSFDLFWSEYPRKQDKKNAFKAWGKIKPDASLCEKIIAAVKAQRLCENWCKDNGKYIPLAATWLNGARWDDEPPSQHARSSINVAPDDYDFMFNQQIL